MKLFHWNLSETLKQYSCGDIIVMAETLEQARAKAFEQFDVWIQRDDSRFNWLCLHLRGTKHWDNDDEEEYQGILQKLKSDLDKIPLDIDDVIFIMGSS